MSIEHFGDYQPSIREQAPDLAQMALERIDDQHGNALLRALDQLGSSDWPALRDSIVTIAANWSADAARTAADLVADTCERRYDPAARHVIGLEWGIQAPIRAFYEEAIPESLGEAPPCQPEGHFETTVNQPESGK